MKNYRKNLPPLDTLIFFQAAAHFGSFSAAAREMRVTQAAVSKRVQRLEDWLGVAVFDRRGRHIELNAVGRLLADDVNLALEFLQRTVKQLKSAEPATVQIAATSSMSIFWLQDRLRDFALSEAACHVNVTTSDDMSILTSSGNDLTIVYSKGPPLGWSGIRVMAGVLAPAATADIAQMAEQAEVFTERWQPANSPVLLEIPNITPDWINWTIWLRRLKLPAIDQWPVTQCASFGQSVGRALQGQGILLANLDMMRADLANGRLVQIGNRYLQPQEAYYLCYQSDKPLSPSAKRLLDFLEAPSISA